MSDTIEAFLNRLHHPALAAIDLSLDRMLRLLSMLGSPEKRLPPVIHVAGTNGKGSLIANLHAIFEAAGLRVHRYISPHLVHFRERIVLQGKEIEDRQLEPILKHVASMLASQPATFFEATTAAAFLAFAEKPADVLLLETGMGGRLDATNVIARPLLTAITPISFDHTSYLGHTLAAIAGEKAGILKPGVACVVGRQTEEALTVIKAQAEKISASLYCFGRDFKVEGSVYESSARRIAFTPGLVGQYQYDNAATAIACMDKLPGFKISDAHVARGLANVRWPARLQRLAEGAFAHVLPAGVELWIDGGHNPAGGEVLADWLKEQKGKSIHLICGMMSGKDSTAFFKPMAPYVTDLTAVAIPGESQSQSAEKTQAAAKQAGIEAFSAPAFEKALQSVLQRAKTPSIVCICGSLYLAGKVLAANR